MYRGDENDLVGYDDYDYEDVDSDGEVNPLPGDITPPWQDSEGQKCVKKSKSDDKFITGSLCISVNLPDNHRSSNPNTFFSKTFGISPLYKFRLEMFVESCSESHIKSQKTNKSESYYDKTEASNSNEFCDKYQFRVKCRFIYLGMKSVKCLTELKLKSASEKAEILSSFDIKMGIEKEKRFKSIMQKERPEFEMFSMAEEVISVDKRKDESITIDIIVDIAKDRKVTWKAPDLQIKSISDDFKILCLDEDSTEFHVSKEVLANRSDVLARAFENDFKETKDAEMKIEDFTKETVESFLKYLQIEGHEIGEILRRKPKSEKVLTKTSTGGFRTHPSTISSIYQRSLVTRELLMIAHKYNVRDLVEICDEYLSESIHITEENVLDWIVFVERYNTKMIAKSILHWKEKNDTFDEKWEEIVYKYPDFAKLVCVMAGNRCQFNRFVLHDSENIFFFPHK